MMHALSLALMFWCGIVSAKDFVIETIRSPRITPSTGVIIHRQAENFIDIEAPIERVWIGCSTIDPKDDTAFLGIKVEDDQITYRFGPRRAVHDVPMCLADEKKYRDILKGAKTVRVVGVMLSPSSNSHPKRFLGDRTPRRFTNKPKIMSGFFTRIQAGDKCVSYFAGDCDLSKNYWAGTTPIE